MSPDLKRPRLIPHSESAPVPPQAQGAVHQTVTPKAKMLILWLFRVLARDRRQGKTNMGQRVLRDLGLGFCYGRFLLGEPGWCAVILFLGEAV